MASDDVFDPDLIELDEISRGNVIVRRMIAGQLAFKRETYIRLRYGDAVPQPWTHAHEKLMPPVFREPNSERIQQALQGLGDAIGVTYTGEIPR